MLIESTFVTLGGDIGAPQEWGLPYLSCEDGGRLNRERLFGADALLLDEIRLCGWCRITA
jgi:hypothetical protein